MTTTTQTEPTVTVGARLPKSLVDRIDTYATKGSKPGLRLSRSDAIRLLLEKALRNEKGASTK